jgi:hypothetical protein
LEDGAINFIHSQKRRKEIRREEKVNDAVPLPLMQFKNLSIFCGFCGKIMISDMGGLHGDIFTQ